MFLSAPYEPPHDKTNKMCAQRRLRSAWAYAQSESLRCELNGWLRTQAFFVRTADAQADLSLRWEHMPLCLFCHEAAHLISKAIKATQSKKTSNDQELIQSDPTSCPINQKGNN